MIVKRINFVTLTLIGSALISLQIGSSESGLLGNQRRKTISSKVLVKPNPEDGTPCEPFPAPELRQILGAAYNNRYMSIEPPSEFDDNRESGSPKRSSEDESTLRFMVDETFATELSDSPAWEVLDHALLKRSPSHLAESDENHAVRPWECEATITWLDLGIDYFPRYLRSVSCKRVECFYGQYICAPRSFTVKLLRRRNEHCIRTPPSTSGWNRELDMPEEFRELWVWEERAVTFCCDCAVLSPTPTPVRPTK